MRQVETIVEALKGHARLTVLLAAWTGLSLAELRGLQWDDIEKDQLTVRRTVWHRTIGEPKTEARNAAVPLLSHVKKAIAAHQKRPGTKFVFEGVRQFPIDLATLEARGSNRPSKVWRRVAWLACPAPRVRYEPSRAWCSRQDHPNPAPAQQHGCYNGLLRKATARRQPRGGGTAAAQNEVKCATALCNRFAENTNGGVAEWLKAAVLKTVRPERVSWVRIPPPPPFSLHVSY